MSKAVTLSSASRSTARATSSSAESWASSSDASKVLSSAVDRALNRPSLQSTSRSPGWQETPAWSMSRSGRTPSRPGEDVPVGVGLGVLLTELAGPDQIGDHGVVVGQLLHVPIPKAVQARVADMEDDRRRVGGHRQGHQCGPHGRILPIRLPPDGSIGVSATVEQPRDRTVGREGPIERVQGQSAGDITVLEATHPVCHCEQPSPISTTSWLVSRPPRWVAAPLTNLCVTGTSFPRCLALGRMGRLTQRQGGPSLDQCLAAGLRFAHDLPVPAIKRIRVGSVEEVGDVVDGYSGPAQQSDDPGSVQLAGGVIAVARRAVDGSRDQEAGGGVRAQHLGRQAAPGREVADAQQFIHA